MANILKLTNKVGQEPQTIYVMTEHIESIHDPGYKNRVGCTIYFSSGNSFFVEEPPAEIFRQWGDLP